VQGGYTNPHRKRLGGDLVDDADSREQDSLKDALHLLAELGKTGTLVSDGRKSCAKRPMWLPLAHVDGCLSHRNLRHLPLDKDADTWWGKWGAGEKVLHDSAGRVTSQPISIGAAERCWKVYACAHSLSKRLGPERAPKLVRVQYNLRLCRKRSNPEFEDVHLPSTAIDPIEEAADDLIVEDDSD
jgi:hypothetical protein